MSTSSTLTVRDRSLAELASGARTLGRMDEDAFRAFYERTARPLWAFLARTTGDPHLADDLLQETYYRFYRAAAPHTDEAHRRNSLFQIASNLASDAGRHGRRIRHLPLPDDDSGGFPVEDAAMAGVGDRTDLTRAMERLRPAQRSMLWLAYVQGASHAEIAAVLGLRTGSIKLLLFRARKQLAKLLGGQS